MLAFQSYECESTKRVRMEQRLPPEAKGLVEQAARLQGVGTSEFVVTQAVMGARETIAKLQVTALQPEDAEAFMRAFENEEPTQELVSIFALHKEVCAAHG